MPEDKNILFWHKKNGAKILIKDMSNDYLLQTLKNLEDQAKNEKGKVVKSKLPDKYHVLKMHAISRDLINK
jgi:hypothetical protein